MAVAIVTVAEEVEAAAEAILGTPRRILTDIVIRIGAHCILKILRKMIFIQIV